MKCRGHRNSQVKRAGTVLDKRRPIQEGVWRRRISNHSPDDDEEYKYNSKPRVFKFGRSTGPKKITIRYKVASFLLVATMSTEDTEMLIVLVHNLPQSNSSQPTLHSDEVVLDALVQHNGNVQAAAQHLINRGKKRKRTNDLTSWFGNKLSKSVKQEVGDDTAVTLSRKPPSTLKPPSSSKKPAVDLMMVLRQASPSPSEKRTLSPPPLLLSIRVWYRSIPLVPCISRSYRQN
ncbi:hypothetical protein IW262DRAFT_568921 [Armillaria fumosa]|nr:hypothetical protein IW262DRAFT_568921 [Armillaria fumosa]